VTETRAQGRTVELHLDARPENLALTRLALAGMAANAGASREAVSDLKLAVTEACTNVIKHAYGDSTETGTMVVRYTLGEGTLAIEVEDSGSGLEPAAAPDGAAYNGGTQGMGLTIIRILTDELTIESTGSGTRVAFVKRLGPDG
jgi:serine/threonine-protein kinase RsbW